MKMRRAAFFLSVLFLTVFVSSSAWPLPKYSEETGWECTVCHVSKTGGSELTSVGWSFWKKEIVVKKKAVPPKEAGVRTNYLPLIFGFFHLAAAFMWFGSILYIHIILKPSYAAQGVPRAEIRLAWICIGILVITGIYLLHHRFASWDLLFSTRTGRLLLLKIVLFLLMLLTAVIVTFFLRFRLGAKKKQVPALLVGFEGKAYDFSKSPMWGDGVHMGRHKAGNDLTDELKNAPHGRDVIERFSALGEWGKEAEPAEAATKAFYILAYMNLAFVFAILFIVALMKWGG
jgi:predicted heme/steroid binding protein